MVDFTFNNTEDCGCDNTPTPLNVNFDTNCNTSSGVSSVAWSNITGLPSCFIPCAHTHTSSQITDLASYLLANEKVDGVIDTNSIDLTLSSKKITASLKISSEVPTQFGIPLEIKTDGLFAEIPFANSTDSGILTNSDWVVFNNKFNTPGGTNSEYVAGDGTILPFPTDLPPSGVAGGDLLGTYPNPNVIWSNGYTDYDSRYYLSTNPSNYINFANSLGTLTLVNSAILSSDNIISAFGKTQGQLNNKWTKPSFTTGSVLFWGSTDVDQNNSKLFWDNSLFKFKLIDSSLELSNTSLLGSSNIEYKSLAGVASTVSDQSSSSIDNWFKIRTYNSTVGNGKVAGLLFGLVDSTDSTAGQIGIMWNSPNVTGAGNELLIRNNYDYNSVIKVEANFATQIDGFSLRRATTYTFSNSNVSKTISVPVNILRFQYGGTTGARDIYLPFDAFKAIPDGYIVVLKATNAKGAAPNVVVNVQGGSGHSAEAHTFTTDYESVIYRYDATSLNWDIISKT